MKVGGWYKYIKQERERRCGEKRRKLNGYEEKKCDDGDALNFITLNQFTGQRTVMIPVLG